MNDLTLMRQAEVINCTSGTAHTDRLISERKELWKMMMTMIKFADFVKFCRETMARRAISVVDYALDDRGSIPGGSGTFFVAPMSRPFFHKAHKCSS